MKKHIISGIAGLVAGVAITAGVTVSRAQDKVTVGKGMTADTKIVTIEKTQPLKISTTLKRETARLQLLQTTCSNDIATENSLINELTQAVGK